MSIENLKASYEKKSNEIDIQINEKESNLDEIKMKYKKASKKSSIRWILSFVIMFIAFLAGIIPATMLFSNFLLSTYILYYYRS